MTARMRAYRRMGEARRKLFELVVMPIPINDPQRRRVSEAIYDLETSARLAGRTAAVWALDRGRRP